MGRGQTPTDDAARLESSLEVGDRRRRTRHHAHPRTVDTRERQAIVEVRLDVLGGYGHGQHCAGGLGPDETSPLGNEPQRVVEGQHAGHARGDVLAQAVADHGARPQPPAHQQPGEGVLDGEHQRLRAGCVHDSIYRPVSTEHRSQIQRRGLRLRIHRAEEDLAEIEPALALQVAEAAVEGLAKDRLPSYSSRAMPGY